MVCSVFSQTNDEERLAQINQNLASAYQSGKVDEALELARQSLDLSLKIFGAEKKRNCNCLHKFGSYFGGEEEISGINRKFAKCFDDLSERFC